MKHDLRLISMEEIQAEEVKWLWYPYLPRGKLTIVQGDPGEGKTTFVLAVIAALTCGEALPETEQALEPINVIYQTAEDGLADTIKPRLEAAGADCSRVLVIDESQRELTLSDERLEQAVHQTGAQLIVLDPIQAYLGNDVDMHRANEVRPILKRVAGMAERTGCGVILIGHMNKAQGLKAGYGGLLRCEDCGRSFVGKRIHTKSGERVEYTCDTYHRYGKEYCSSHTVDERILDELITKELMQTKAMYEENFQTMEQLIDQWQPKASAAIAQIKKQQERIAMLEEEMEAILMERIRDKANTERYDRMIQKREAEIAAAQKQIEELQNIEETLRSRQAKLKRDISMMDDILKEGHLSEAHLRLLVDKIYVHEENGKLSLDICLKAPFRDHMDIYENGEQTECYLSQSYDFERLGPIIMKDFWENG